MHEIMYRMMDDLRKMNEQLYYWSYPLMRMERIFSELYGTKPMSELEVRSGYYDINVDNK